MKVEEIEGIGPAYAAKLTEAGVSTVEELLEKAGAKAGREKLAESTGISEKLILEWANRADLMRVKGVGQEYSDLLEAAGVDTVKELARRNPENLHQALAESNEKRQVVRRIPGLSQVTEWVEFAKTLEPKISH